jgi:integrase
VVGEVSIALGGQSHDRVGDHLDHFKLGKRFYAALDKAELRRVRFHDLRHAFGTAAIAKLDPSRSSPTWAIRTTRPPAATCTTSPSGRDAAALAEAFAPSADEAAALASK